MAKKKSNTPERIVYSFHLRFASKKRNVRKAAKFMLEVRKNIPLDDELFGNILIALTEAVNNAIIHGNKNDEKKFVTIHCDCYGNRLEFLIKDEGKGFNPSIIPNPLEEENLLKEGGRGVHIIRTLMDKVQFQNLSSGMEISFSKKLSSTHTKVLFD